MLRTKGEAGTGNIVEAVRHLRAVHGRHPPADHARARGADGARPSTLGAPYELRARGRRRRPAAGAELRRRRHRHAGRRGADDAARRRGGVRGLRHLQVGRSRARRARAIVRATTHYEDAEARGRGLARPRRGRCAGSRSPRRCRAARAAAGARLVSASRRRARAAGRLRGAPRACCGDSGADGARGPPRRRRSPAWRGLVLPGGESTALLRLMADEPWFAALRGFHARGGALLGTCAGAILLAREVESPRSRASACSTPTVARNAYGRQLDSFEADGGRARALGRRRCAAVFIRAPRFRAVGAGGRGAGAASAASRCWCGRAACWPPPSTPS